MNTITYHSINASADQAWLAYVLLPNGEPWLVRCHGSTEDEAKLRAITLWEKELAKPRARQADEDGPVDPGAKPHHLAGRKWAINIATREKRFEDAAAIEALIATGEWVTAGPRSK